MAVIANWLNEHIQKKTVDKIVEDTHADTVQEDPILNEYFPIEMYNDRNFLGMVIEKIRPIASVIGYNGKAPTTSAGDFRQVVQQFAKLGLQYSFTEEMQFRMEEVQRYAGLQGITVQDLRNPDGSVNKAGSGGKLADFIFGKPRDLTIGLQNVLDNFAWQIPQFGKIEYTDPRTNISLSVNYLDPGATYDFFPAPGQPCTFNNGSVIPNGTYVSWDDYENADGILDIELDCEAFRKVNGTYPKAIAMSKTAHRHLIRQKTTVEYAATFSTGVTAAKMSNVVLSRVLEDRGLPPLVIHDRLYDIEDNNGEFSKARFLSEDKYVMLSANLGNRAWGPCIEHKKSLYDSPKAGIYLNTYQDPLNSAHDIMEAKATALAIALNPKLLLARTCVFS
jgi:hypothetical protein